MDNGTVQIGRSNNPVTGEAANKKGLAWNYHLTCKIIEWALSALLYLPKNI